MNEQNGKWIERTEKQYWMEDDANVYYECSRCGLHSVVVLPSCPRCNANMQGRGSDMRHDMEDLV